VSLDPAPSVRSLAVPPRLDNVFAVLERDAGPPFALAGSGKAAIREGVGLLRAGQSDNVVLPGYLPDGVIEPFRDAGLDVRFHRIDRDLTPDLADVERLVDADTAAILVVHYFGFPQPSLGELRELCDRRGIALVEDNAHAPLSRGPDSRLLGTTGDLGVTSLHKLFPVPDGGMLFVGDPALRDRDGTLELSGVAAGYTLADLAPVGRALLRPLLAARASVPVPGPELPSWQSGGPGATTERDPEAIYEAAKTPMSKLTVRALRRLDPSRCVERRRRNYRFWSRSLDGIGGLDPVYGSLPEGVCPQVFPALADDPAALADAGDGRNVPVSTWPPLPDEAEDAAAFPATNWLSDHLVRLPVHQQLDETDLSRIAETIRGA